MITRSAEAERPQVVRGSEAECRFTDYSSALDFSLRVDPEGVA